MKQAKILLLAVVALLLLMSVSCTGAAQPTGGWSGPTVHDGVVYVGTRDGRVVAINASTQGVQWQWPDISGLRSLIYTTPIVDGDLVYVGTYGGEVYALDTADGEYTWVYPPKGEGYIGAVVGTPVIANETIYVSSSDGRIYALNTTNGKRKWQSDPSLADKLWTSPAVVGDTLYVSTFDGHVYSLSVETGELLDWSFESQAGFTSSPVIDEGIVYVGSFDRYLYAVRVGDSEPLWKFLGGKWFWAPPLVSNGVVYASCLDGRLYGISAETGEELWAPFETKDQSGNPAPIVSPPVLIGNLLIVANEAGNVYVINRETGDGERIENPDNGNEPTISAQIRASLCADEGLVYVRGEDNRLYAVDIDNREVRWKVSLTIE